MQNDIRGLRKALGIVESLTSGLSIQSIRVPKTQLGCKRKEVGKDMESKKQ